MNKKDRQLRRLEIKSELLKLLDENLIEDISSFFQVHKTTIESKGYNLPSYFKTFVDYDLIHDYINIEYVKFYDKNHNEIIYPSDLLYENNNYENDFNRIIHKLLCNLEDYQDLPFTVCNEDDSLKIYQIKK